jgi:DNA primase
MAGLNDRPQFPISPVLEYYGGDPVEEDRRWHEYRCPFHDDSNKSAAVRTLSGEEEVFNCHAVCGVAGNAVQIIMKREGVGYREALGRAEEITGRSITSVRGERRSGAGVPRPARDRFSYREYKATWVCD